MSDSTLATRLPLGPEWLAHRYDEAADAIRFVDYDRGQRQSVPFLIDDHLPARAYRAISRHDARSIGETAPIHFIFHSGFCCSTLLAACLDAPGLASSFSEPMILNDIVGWRLRGAPPESVEAVLSDAIRLLARPFAEDQMAIVKPSSVVNGLAAAIMAIRPQANAIVMHAPLEDFLISIAKKGLDGRRWARELFVNLRAEGLVQNLGFDDYAFFAQTDLQIAAIAWLVQQTLFEKLLVGGDGRIRALDSRTFLADPNTNLQLAGAHFGLAIDAGQLERIVAGPLQRNSKDRGRFTAADRADEYDRMRLLYGDEIDKVVHWTHVVAESANVAINLSSPLSRQ